MEQLLVIWQDADFVTRITIALLMLHPIASVITAYTATPTDDTVWGWIYNMVIRPLALNKGLATQDTPDKPATPTVEPKQE